MISQFDYYNFKLDIINFNYNNINEIKIKKVMQDIANPPTLLTKWDAVFYTLRILNILQGVPDSQEKELFVDFFTNSLFRVSSFTYDISEKKLLNIYCQLSTKNINVNTETLKDRISILEDILKNKEFLIHMESKQEYIYWYVREKVRQLLVLYYNQLSSIDFYKYKDKIAKQLEAIQITKDDIFVIDKEIEAIVFISNN